MEEQRLTREYEQLLERFGIDYKRVKDSYPNCITSGFFNGGKFFSHDLPNEQVWIGRPARAFAQQLFCSHGGHANTLR